MAPSQPPRLNTAKMKDQMSWLLESDSGASYLCTHVWFTNLWMYCRTVRSSVIHIFLFSDSQIWVSHGSSQTTSAGNVMTEMCNPYWKDPPTPSTSVSRYSLQYCGNMAGSKCLHQCLFFQLMNTNCLQEFKEMRNWDPNLCYMISENIKDFQMLCLKKTLSNQELLVKVHYKIPYFTCSECL